MDSLRSILPGVLHKRGLFTHAKAAQVTMVAQQWIHSALPRLAAFIAVEKLSHATLTITCTHGIAAQECMPLLPSLKEFLRKECQGAVVQEIRMIRA